MSDEPKTTHATAGSIPATVDVQDPFPEQDWTWRRIYTYALTLVCCFGVGFGLHALYDLGDNQAIYSMSRWMLAIIALLATYYMVAPSAEQITHLVQAARTLQAGVPLTRRSTVTTPSGTLESVSTAGTASETPEEDFAPRSST